MNFLSRLQVAFFPGSLERLLESLIQHLHAEVVRLRDREAFLDSELGLAQRDLRAERAHVTLLNSQLAAKIDEVSEARDEATAAYRERDEANALLVAANRRAHELHAELGDTQNAAQAERVELTNKIEETLSRIAILETELRARGGRQVDLVESQPVGSSAPEGEAAADEYEVVSDSTHQEAHRIIGVFFEGRTHWRLGRDDHQIKAVIHDKAFLDRLRSREVAISAGDVLRAQFRVVTHLRRSDGDSYTTFSVESDTEILSPAQQTAFPTAAAPVAEPAGVSS